MQLRVYYVNHTWTVMLQTKMATTEEAVDALTAQMQSWQSKANALEARNRVLQHIVDSSSTHLSELVTEQVSSLQP